MTVRAGRRRGPSILPSILGRVVLTVVETGAGLIPIPEDEDGEEESAWGTEELTSIGKETRRILLYSGGEVISRKAKCDRGE